MPSVYQTVFGGNVVAPAIPTYLSLPISASVVLGWPLESNITSPAAAEIIDVSASVGGLTVQLSDARQVSTGYCALFNNVGANTFSVLDAQGNTLFAPTSGQAWQLYLSDNSTLQGTWRVFQYGASVSNANAATLAGNGLKAISTTLNERIFINAQGSNYSILSSDRAACVEWTGGAGGVFTAPAPATVGSDWFCYIKNSGTAVLTVTPSTGTIDGNANKTFNPGDSCILVSDGTTLFTLGFGQAVASSFNFVTISLAGSSGTVILTGAQLNRISYKFTGALAGNVIVQVPGSIQQYWVDNETTGAFTLTISAGGAGTTVTVPQATRTILYCDGLNIVNAISSGAIQFGDGTAAAPSITFASDLTLGLYKAGADVLGISTAGVQRVVINASGQVTINAPGAGDALTVSGNLTVNVPAGLISLNSTTATSPALIFYSLGGVNKARLGVEGTAGGTITGSSIGDLLLWSTTGVDISTTSGGLNARIDSVGVVTFQGTSGNINLNSTTATNAAIVFFNLGGTNKVRIGAEGTAGSTITGSQVGDALVYSTTGFDVTTTAGNLNLRVDSVGALTTQGVAGQHIINSTTTTNAALEFFNLGGINKARVGAEGTAGATITGSLVGDAFLLTTGGNFIVSTNTGGAIAFKVDSANGLSQCLDESGTLWDIGFRDMPGIVNSGALGFTLTHRGKFINQQTASTLTIPANVSIPFAIGAVIVVGNFSGGTVTIAITTDTLILAGTATTGSRTLAPNALCTLVKGGNTTWLASGSGVS